MEKQIARDNSFKLINKTFKQIGKYYSKSRIMSFMADGKTQKLEEPDNTFTSMNFVWTLIMELPSKHYVIMNKEQAIRFIRVVKQRILKILDIDIDFINMYPSKMRNVINESIHLEFIEKLKNTINNIIGKYAITDDEIYLDNPDILRKYLVNKLSNASVSPSSVSSGSVSRGSVSPSSVSPSSVSSGSVSRGTVSPSSVSSGSVSRGSVSRKYISKYTSEQYLKFIENDIINFQFDMEKIDEEDKAQYTEMNTDIILRDISRLKHHYLDLFTQQIYSIEQENYDEEVKELISNLIHQYTVELTNIRMRVHLNYYPKYKSPNSPEYKSHSDIVEIDIMDFQIKLEEIDEEDKKKHELKHEMDTPEIVQSIDNLKVEFLDLFIPKIRALFEEYYTTDLKELKDTLIRNYTERLVGIRNSAHFKGSTGFQKYDMKRFDVRKEKEQARITNQQLLKLHKNNSPVTRKKPVPKGRKSRTVTHPTIASENI